MANIIKLRRSAVQGAVPTTSQLDLGEVAINTFDGKLFIKKDNGAQSIVEIGASTGGGGGEGTTITTQLVTSTSITAQKDYRYILTNAQATTLTLPLSPSIGDTVYIVPANNLITNVVDRNGSNIMGIAENLTIDVADSGFSLCYSGNSTLGWVLA